MSWLPGTQRAEPSATMLRTSRSVSRIRGPRSTRSPRKTALRPSGCGKARLPQAGSSSRCTGSIAELPKQGFQFVAAAVHIADDVERPVLVPLVVPERRPLDRGRLDLLGRVEDEDVARSPRASARASIGAVATAAAGSTCGPKSRSSRPWFRSCADLLGQVEDDGHRQAVVLPGKLRPAACGPRAGHWWRPRPSAVPGPAACGR